MPAFRKTLLLTPALILAPLLAFATTAAGHARKPAPEIAVAPVLMGQGASAGVAMLIRQKDGLALRLELTGLPAGEHGLHLHTKGLCVGPDFVSAGGHLNPEHHQHGHDNPLGAHLGDLPNITAGADGLVTSVVPLTGAPDALIAAMFDADGVALVVHAKADDYKTDPTGNAGGRIACGVFRRG